MPINVRDKFRFLFGDGKGIDATQVRSYLSNPPQAGDDLDSWLTHIIQRLDAIPTGYPAPQSLTGSVTGSISVGQQRAITFSSIGSEASYCLLDTSTTGNDPPAANGNLIIAKAGVYRLFGEIAYTGSDRTGPTFQAQRTDGGSGLINLGHTNAYSRDADTELIIDRQLDFYIPADNTRISISVWNRAITTSNSYGTMTLSASNVDNMYLLPLGSPS